MCGAILYVIDVYVKNECAVQLCILTLLSCLQVMDMLGPSLWDVWNSSGQA